MQEPKFEKLQSLNIDQLAKQRNWDNNEKQEVEDLFSQLKILLSGRTYQQVWDDYDKQQTEENKQKLEQIITIVNKLINILEKNKFPGLATIIGETTDGEKFELKIAEKMEEWRTFYEEHGVDWVVLPEKITITPEQQEEMARVISELKPEKQEDIEIIIVPKGLADTGEKYEKLHELMTEGYNESYQDRGFKEDGGFAGLKNKSNELKIIITKNSQNLESDEVFKQTLNKSVDDLEESEGIFEETDLRGVDMMTYLILQRKYFKETGKHLDEKGWTLLTEIERLVSGHVPYVSWVPDFSELRFYSNTSVYHSGSLGCRLASSFII